MKLFFWKLVEIIKFILSYLFVLSDPVVKLIMRLMYLSQAQSKVNFPIPVTSQFDGGINVVGTGNVIWGEYCRFGKDVILETQGEGMIRLGDNVRINQGSILVSHEKITIGNDCLIGEYCSVRDANHNIKRGEIIRYQGHTHSAITVGNDCWIGRGTAVLKGVNLHDGAVVGANSVVTKDIQTNVIAFGSPAKGFRERKK